MSIAAGDDRRHHNKSRSSKQMMSHKRIRRTFRAFCDSKNQIRQEIFIIRHNFLSQTCLSPSLHDFSDISVAAVVFLLLFLLLMLSSCPF